MLWTWTMLLANKIQLTLLRFALENACWPSFIDFLKNIQKNWFLMGKIHWGNQIKLRSRWSELNRFWKIYKNLEKIWCEFELKSKKWDFNGSSRKRVLRHRRATRGWQQNKNHKHISNLRSKIQYYNLENVLLGKGWQLRWWQRSRFVILISSYYLS